MASPAGAAPCLLCIQNSMQLPDVLRHAIEEALADEVHAELAAAAERISLQYRRAERGSGSTFLPGQLERLAYAITRLPATYAATCAALGHLRQQWPAAAPRTLLDLGAGSGSASWAACSLFPSLHSITLIERDPHLIALGQRLAACANATPLSAATWQAASLAQTALPDADLVIASYVLNELGRDEWADVVRAMWNATAQALVIVEPGTTSCFERIDALRTLLIDAGAHLLAPCPHAQRCPLRADDWCHFSQRVTRTAQHRLFKGGDLGYEDEKFSYLIFTRSSAQRAPARILRHPQRRSGHIHLQLCEQDGLRDAVVSRRSGPAWKIARKAQWGDAWNEG